MKRIKLPSCKQVTQLQLEAQAKYGKMPSQQVAFAILLLKQDPNLTMKEVCKYSHKVDYLPKKIYGRVISYAKQYTDGFYGRDNPTYIELIQIATELLSIPANEVRELLRDGKLSQAVENC